MQIDKNLNGNGNVITYEKITDQTETQVEKQTNANINELVNKQKHKRTNENRHGHWQKGINKFLLPYLEKVGDLSNIIWNIFRREENIKR